MFLTYRIQSEPLYLGAFYKANPLPDGYVLKSAFF